MEAVRTEILKSAAVVFCGGLVGFGLGQPMAGAAMAAWLLIARHIFHASRLLQWLRFGKASEYPQTSGLWDEIFFSVYLVRRRSKRRKKRLLRLLERFREATAALPDATVVLGPKHEIVWFNQAAAQLLALRKEDIGQCITNLLRSPRFVEYLRLSDYEQSVGINSPNSEDKKLDIRIVPYATDLYLLLAQDVTQLRFMERVRSDFVANVSHELRTPLTVLRGYLEALPESDQPLPERLGRVYARMSEQTARMQSLVDGLLSLTRLESGIQHQPAKLIDVGSLLRMVCDDARFLDGEERRNIELSLESDAGLWGIEPDIVSAFSNLVVNAVKFTRADGKIRVRWYEEASGAVFEVEDTGCGVAAEHIPRLTERFYRVEVPGAVRKTGTGLGLAIVKHVLSRHDSQLKILSEEGKGSRFICTFPAKRVVRQHAAAS